MLLGPLLWSEWYWELLWSLNESANPLYSKPLYSRLEYVRGCSVLCTMRAMSLCG